MNAGDTRVFAARKTAAVIVFALLAGACGGGGEVKIEDAWARASAGMQDAGAVYLTIVGGDAADRLVGASVSAGVAGDAQLHETTANPEGVMSMHTVLGIDVPAHGRIALEPGGYHVMLLTLAEPLEAGQSIVLTLRFEKAGDVEVTADIRER